VDAAVDRALTPWRTSRQIADAIKDACEGYSIPYDMRHDAGWKARMYQAAGTAVGRLRNGASLEEVKMAAKQAVASLVQEFEHGTVCAQMVKDVWMKLSGATSEECEQGRDAVRAALAKLPVGASKNEMERVRENALGPTRVNIAARHDRNMREGMLQWIELRYKVRELPRDEQQAVLREIREALNQLPSGTSRAALDEAIDSVIDRHYNTHQQREKEKKEAARREAEEKQKHRDAEAKANVYLSHIEEYLKSEYEFDGGFFEMCRERDRLREPIRKALIAELLEDQAMAADDIRDRIEKLVDDEL
jgi:hypothetical protein